VITVCIHKTWFNKRLASFFNKSACFLIVPPDQEHMNKIRLHSRLHFYDETTSAFSGNINLHTYERKLIILESKVYLSEFRNATRKTFLPDILSSHIKRENSTDESLKI
jgi:hypothetical protein